ncbi:MAG: type II toxin-antitoxin system prevent-host-death family antitoxin [Desulfovibrionaceae bacterium]|nr:type II toxin-antitoxin system prevent-host-death family antitoxin [Desulfovibrionaceae bacterium]
MESVLADMTVSVTELKRGLAEVLKAVQARPVAVLSHNKPAAYLLSADLYEKLADLIDDALDAKAVKERGDGPFVEVDINEL